MATRKSKKSDPAPRRVKRSGSEISNLAKKVASATSADYDCTRVLLEQADAHRPGMTPFTLVTKACGDAACKATFDEVQIPVPVVVAVQKAAKEPTAKTARKTRESTYGARAIERSYKGAMYAGNVAADGSCLVNGQAYHSLTAAAKAITGYPAISGPAFFGLWKAAKAEGGAR